MDDYRTGSNISDQPYRFVFEHESAFNTVTHASLLNCDYERMSLLLAGWFEKIQRSVPHVLYEKELQTFLLNFLNSLKCFTAAQTLPVYESLTRGLGSCHSVLALQMRLYRIVYIFSSAAIKPFDFVIALPNHDTSSTPLFSATYVKKTGASRGFQIDVVHPGNTSTIYQNPCLQIHMQHVINLVPTISYAYHHASHLARKMGMILKYYEQNCDGERTSTDKLVGALEVVGTTTTGQQIQVTAILIINQSLPIKQMFPLRFDAAMIFLLIPDAHIDLIICGTTHKTLDRAVLPGAFWSAQIFKDRNPLEPHSTLILAFVLIVVFHPNMNRQVYPILPDLGLQKHRHVLAYFFMTYSVLALFFFVATMLIKDVHEKKIYLIEVMVIHMVLLCQPRIFSVEIIGSLQVDLELSPMRYFSGSHVLLPTIDFQSVVDIILQDGLLMILEAERGLDKSTLLLNPSFFAPMARWFLDILFGDNSAIFESLSILLVDKLVTLKYKKAALDAIYPTTIFYVASVFFLQQQLVRKFRPYQIVEPPSHYMTKQEILAIFQLWLLSTLLGLRVWVITLHGLIVVWAPMSIGSTFFTRELKFDHKSCITLAGATAIRLIFHFGEGLHITSIILVFHFGEDLHTTNSNSRMEYSILRNTKDDTHLIYYTLWCLPLFTCVIPNDVVWSRSWLLDYTSTWDLMIMDDEATLYPLTMICKVTTEQYQNDEYMVQNYLGAISTWGCSTYKIKTQIMLQVLGVIRTVGVLVLLILLYKPIVNIANMKTFVFAVLAFYILHRSCARGRAAILIFSIQASCWEESVKVVSTTHALCDDHEGALSMPNRTAQVLLSLPPRVGNHVMLHTQITEGRMVSAEIFWAHFPIPTYLRHEDMPSFKGAGLVRTISLDT